MNVGNECDVADLTFYCIHPLDTLRAPDGFDDQLLICVNLIFGSPPHEKVSRAFSGSE